MLYVSSYCSDAAKEMQYFSKGVTPQCQICVQITIYTDLAKSDTIKSADNRNFTP